MDGLGIVVRFLEVTGGSSLFQYVQIGFGAHPLDIRGYVPESKAMEA
jgi:hypothetical protein